jgi:hypothetical protein
MQPAGSAAAHIDLSKVLLPKKEGTPSVDSAQRINAGVLFEQEQQAGATGPAEEKPPVPETPAPPNPAAPKPERELVQPLQTYQSDIESLVGEKQVSVVSIAAAEADRRGMSKIEDSMAPLRARQSRRTMLIIAGGVVLVALAGGIGFYIYAKLQPVPVAQQQQAPFILVDDTQTITVTSNDGRSSIMQMLVAAKDKIALAPGLVSRILVAQPTAANDGSLQEMSAPAFLQALTPKVPPELVRTLEPQMLVGVHSYDQNQAFMILKSDSYETAYSAMLAWEDTIQNDLSPLFDRTPAVHLRSDVPATSVLPPATTTASTTRTASSTPATASSTLPVVKQILASTFVDQVVDNHDARVLLNPAGDILLLWTFIDRSTIVITTNEATLREVISRLSQASVVSLPAVGQ